MEKSITNAKRVYYAFLLLKKNQSVQSAEKIKICKALTKPVATFGPES